MSEDIRVVALGAVERGDELLVQDGVDPQTGERFYRLLGGGVEFGEHSREAVVREFEEELGVDFVDPTLVGTFERVFTFAGETGHELWRVYAGTSTRTGPTSAIRSPSSSRSSAPSTRPSGWLTSGFAPTT